MSFRRLIDRVIVGDRLRPWTSPRAGRRSRTATWPKWVRLSSGNRLVFSRRATPPLLIMCAGRPEALALVDELPGQPVVTETEVRFVGGHRRGPDHVVLRRGVTGLSRT